MSQLVTMMTQDEDAAKGDVPLTDVKSAVLAKVIEFCSHHVDQRLPEIEKVRRLAGPGVAGGGGVTGPSGRTARTRGRPTPGC